jgi:hypothetical protein
MPENSYDLLRLPAPALNMIRRAVNGELGVQLTGPGGVAMYLFGSGQYVLYNMSDETASVTLRFGKKVGESGWRELVHGRQLAVTEEKPQRRFDGGGTHDDVSLTLRSFEIAVVQSPDTGGAR